MKVDVDKVHVLVIQLKKKTLTKHNTSIEQSSLRRQQIKILITAN